MNAKTARQWMVTHEWMVKPMRQTEWIDGKGIMVWLAEVFSALGSGLYLVAVAYWMITGDTRVWWGALFGWLIIMLFKFPLHLFYLGKPLRFWRAFPPFSKAWKTSWFARGVVFTAAFAGFGLIQLILGALLHWDVVSGGGATAVTVLHWVFMVLGGIFIILTGVYCGFAMSFCKSVPFWNTGLLPIVFLIMGVADGLALLVAVFLGLGVAADSSAVTSVESVSRMMLILNAVLIIAYLVNANYQSATGELSVKELIKGRVAAVFWLGIIFLGILVPLVISIVGLAAEHSAASLPLLVVAVVCHTIGAFCLKYGVLKVGIYRPLLPKASAY